MSGRDLIYRDLSCWPTPLHYHPAHACGPFYLTLLHSLPPSRTPHPPTVSYLSMYLSNCLSFCVRFCLSVYLISYAYHLYVQPNQMDLPSHERFIFSFKSKRDMQLIVRDSFYHALPLPLVAGASRATVMHFYLYQVT